MFVSISLERRNFISETKTGHSTKKGAFTGPKNKELLEIQSMKTQ